MKAIRTYLLKWYVTVPLSLTVVLVSCNSQNESVEPSIASYDGKEIFKGLMFSRGEVASMFPELSKEVVARASLDGELLEDIVKLEDNMIKIIEAKNPDYFDQFKSSITSGKHLVTQEALYEGQELILNTAYEISGRKAPDIASIQGLAKAIPKDFDIKEVIEEDGSVNLEKLAVINENPANAKIDEEALLILVLVVAVAIVWVVLAEIGTAQNNESSLKKEQLVHSIVSASITETSN